MVSLLGSRLRNTIFHLDSLYSGCSFSYNSHALSSLVASSPSHSVKETHYDQPEQYVDSATDSDVNFVVEKVSVGSSPNEIFESLMCGKVCNKVQVSHNLVDKLLYKFKDDWKSALGVFRWAGSQLGYKHTPKAYDDMVDILGRMKQMDQMRSFLEEMNQHRLVTLQTLGKAMRRFAGAGLWEDAVRVFDELVTFGLEKNVESMNLMLDTLCKERKVEQAREIFLELKCHILPNANTFNIFIHGWCKINRVDEAYWTIQEMKGYGCQPCVISYSTIIQFHCHQSNFVRVYELLDEMEAQGCLPNVVTYTTILCSLTKSEMFEEALQIAKRMKYAGCKPDVLFYNALIHTLGRAGRLHEAVYTFEEEMPNNSIPPNTSTYNTMIAMFCHNAQELEAMNLLKEMENSRLCKPDVHTYYPLLKSCFRTGQVDSLLRDLLDDMVKKHHLSLDISAYTMLIHGLCKADNCDWAYRLFMEMISQDIAPRYRTCHLLLEEVRQNNMDDAAAKIEAFMKKL